MLVSGACENPEKTGRSGPSDRPGAGHNRPVRVLIVEDEVHLAQAITEGLEAEGFDVDAVHDGLDGLWRAREGSYDAVVLDVLLPGMNGYRVCKTLREEGIWTPILILTAKDGEYDEAEALDTGADDFLSKPFSFVVLLARLRALFRRGAPPRPPVLTFGPLHLDPASRSVAHGETHVSLTAREFALLEYLMRRDGNVASKPEILDHVWGMDFDGDPNVVEVYIGYLRRKLDQPFGTQLIKTVRGAGYRLCDTDADESAATNGAST
jgi:two-component system, OmpR family, response regulator